MTPIRNRIAHFQNLVSIALVDGILHEKEKEILTRKAITLNLDENTVKTIYSNLKYIDFAAPLKHEERVAFLNDAFDVILADGNVDIREVEKCVNTCIQMGLDMDFIDDALAQRGYTRDLYK